MANLDNSSDAIRKASEGIPAQSCSSNLIDCAYNWGQKSVTAIEENPGKALAVGALGIYATLGTLYAIRGGGALKVFAKTLEAQTADGMWVKVEGEVLEGGLSSVKSAAVNIKSGIMQEFPKIVGRVDKDVVGLDKAPKAMSDFLERGRFHEFTRFQKKLELVDRDHQKTLDVVKDLKDVSPKFFENENIRYEIRKATVERDYFFHK